MAKSLKAFTDWAIKSGSVATPANTFKGQCVSLIQQYLNQVFGVPFAPRGNAKDFVPPTFKKVTGKPRPGDIVRYGASFGEGYGHIGFIDQDGKFIDQNGDKPLKVNRKNIPYPGYTLFRPTKPFALKDKELPTFRIAVPVARIRSQANTKSKTVGLTRLGKSFVILKTVKGEKVSGNSKWYQVGNGLFISATVTNKK